MARLSNFSIILVFIISAASAGKQYDPKRFFCDDPHDQVFQDYEGGKIITLTGNRVELPLLKFIQYGSETGIYQSLWNKELVAAKVLPKYISKKHDAILNNEKRIMNILKANGTNAMDKHHTHLYAAVEGIILTKEQAAAMETLPQPVREELYKKAPEVMVLVMTLVEDDLFEFFSKKVHSLSLPVLENILSQALRAINNAHVAGVVHSDLHLGNFGIIRGQIILLDFGLATHISDPNPNSKENKPYLLQFINKKGARDYIPLGPREYLKWDALEGAIRSWSHDYFMFACSALEMFQISLPWNNRQIEKKWAAFDKPGAMAMIKQFRESHEKDNFTNLKAYFMAKTAARYGNIIDRLIKVMQQSSTADATPNCPLRRTFG